jgi:hypothetical protein
MTCAHRAQLILSDVSAVVNIKMLERGQQTLVPLQLAQEHGCRQELLWHQGQVQQKGNMVWACVFQMLPRGYSS